ncbi:MAG: glycosyltransferase [Lachnospiraceae bacterium]|nr:glycosyltransferase [Candidatus Colinaster equi]
MTKNKISVILPSYNVVDYIVDAVTSVLEQTLKEIEIICVDAGSEDGTWEKLEYFANLDSRVILIKSDKKSYGYQVNLGLEISQGEYIAIVETDDFVQPEMYEVLYSLAVANDCDYIKANYRAYWTQNDGKKIFTIRENLQKKELYGKVISPKEYTILGTDDWYLWTGIYKREQIEKNHIRLSESKGAAFQDIGFLIKTIQHADRVMYIDDKLYNYCIDREGASSRQNRSLEYSYTEFKSLMKYPRSEKWENELFYHRMLRSFMCCVSEIYFNDCEEKQEYIRWFIENLQRALEKDYLNVSVINESIWSNFNLLCSDIEEYFYEREKWKNRIINALREKEILSIVIFGCGNYGYDAYKWTKRECINLLGFMDNNEELWNTRIDGIRVFSPNDIASIDQATGFVIANEKSYLQIRDQLLLNSISETRIYRYR